MSKRTSTSIYRRLVITTSASALLALGTVALEAQATSDIARTSAGTPMILAATEGMERRQDRRDDRQDDRGDRRDDRRDCREEEGVGKDKRDCKQEARGERNEDG